MTVNDIIRAAGGFTAAARKFGVSRTTITRWRHDGTIPGRRLQHIARVLGVPADRLVGIVSSVRDGE